MVDKRKEDRIVEISSQHETAGQQDEVEDAGKETLVKMWQDEDIRTDSK